MGAPLGNQNAKKAKEWERALKSELHYYEDKALGIEKGQALAVIARTVIRKAVDGSKRQSPRSATRSTASPLRALSTTWGTT